MGYLLGFLDRVKGPPADGFIEGWAMRAGVGTAKEGETEGDTDGEYEGSTGRMKYEKI